MNAPRVPKLVPIRDDDVDRKRREIAEGRADFEAGRVHTHKTIKEWLLSWGKPDEKPAPKCK